MAQPRRVGWFALIPRYQKVIFFGLAGSIALMAVFLFYERQRVRDRLTMNSDLSALVAPLDVLSATVTFEVANDREGTITSIQREVTLPEGSSTRAQALLDRLMTQYALPDSNHVLARGAAVEDVFLLKGLPGVEPNRHHRGDLAVINLRGNFLLQHPSGVQTEMLTLLSMLGTLHANFPEVREALFVVDGKMRPTLAGHVDLERTYPVLDTTVEADSLQPAP